MKTLSIERVGKPVSTLALGTGAFGTSEQAVATALLDRFVAAGGTLIDTAQSYGAGESERAIGVWLAERGARDRVVILDKGCYPLADGRPRVTPEAFRADLADSLRRLNTDAIDLYLLHRDDERLPVGPIVEALNEEAARGSIGAFGGSNWAPRRIEEANEYAAARGLLGFVASSPNLSLARAREPMWTGCRYTDEADRAWYARTGMPLIAWSSQAGGFFTGRYSLEDRSDADMVRVYYAEGNWERLRRAREVAAGRGVHALVVALAWVLQQPFPKAAIIGPRSLEELDGSLAAAALELTPSELAYVDLEHDSLS